MQQRMLKGMMLFMVDVVGLKIIDDGSFFWEFYHKQY